MKLTQIVRCWVAWVVSAVVILAAATSRAEVRSCDGPVDCCPSKLADDLTNRIEVGVGVVFVGLYNVNEKASTWDADYYLREVWRPTAGFVPQTEIVNEVTRQAQQFDTTELRDGRCVRNRRIHSTLHTRYNLRAFPFDHQRLGLQLSDAQYPARWLTYRDAASVVELDDLASNQLATWKVEARPSYEHARRVFKGDDGAPEYDYASFVVDVRRHITYHLTKFFLPLFVIFVVALAALWVHPDDLSSRVGIGVTCLLAAIALQLTENGSLPEVEYLTLADRVYAVAYLVLAVAVLVSVASNVTARSGRKGRAQGLDRICRVVIPAVATISTVVAVLQSLGQPAG